MSTQLVVALDEPTFEKAHDVVRRTGAHVEWYKVGYEAYIGYGDRILAALADAGKSLFLDLKLHDIPNTVAAGVRAAAARGARLLTVHAAGGAAMLNAAAAARDEAGGPRLRLLAVTVLTSMDEGDLEETGVVGNPAAVALARTRLAQRNGIDGVVCAVAEAAAVRTAAGSGFAIACPGIRPAGADAGDQRRVAAPADAVRAGVDFIVVGRPITRAADPASAAERILDELRSAAPR